MSDTQRTSDTLSRLKRYAEQNAREPWIPVKATELLALVECAEAAKRFKTARIGEMSLALQTLDAAVSKLEDL